MDFVGLSVEDAFGGQDRAEGAVEALELSLRRIGPGGAEVRFGLPGEGGDEDEG